MKQLFLIFYHFFDNYVHLRRIKFFLSKNVILDDPVIFDIGSHKGKIVKLRNVIRTYNNSIEAIYILKMSSNVLKIH